MNEAANKALVRRWFDEVWNKGQETTIDKLFAPNGIAHGLGDTEAQVRGPAEIKPFIRNIRSAIPDVRISIEDIIAEGNKVAVRVVLEGTHSGDSLGVPASGRRVRLAGIILLDVAEDQIIEGWNSWDQLGLLRQIGALPATGGSDRFLTASS